MSRATAECPACGNDSHLCTPQTAKEVYDTNSWRGKTGLLEVSSTDQVCGWCKAIRMNGEWTRMQSVSSRANELAQSSSTKNRSDYRDSLTAGERDI